MSKPRIAIVHDYLNQYGGAERVLESLHALWPEAPVFTSIYNREKLASYGFDDRGWDIRTSFIQNIKFRTFFPKFYLTFLYPWAFASFDLKEFDIVISSSSYAAKNITKRRSTLHVCYCHTPPRFLYGFDQETNVKAMKWWERLAAKLSIPLLRKMDQEAAREVDYFIANSGVVKDRINRIYKKESRIIYPPVDVERFEKKHVDRALAQEGYFLVISRLGEYKRVDLVVDAFNRLGLRLKVIGTGPQKSYLESIAEPNIEMLGRVDDVSTTTYLQNAIALIFPTEEDFGITPVESLAAGKPVIAYKGGGALETLTDESACFFYPQTSEALVAAIKNFDPSVYNPSTLKKQADNFSKDKFESTFKEFVEDVWQKNSKHMQ